MSANFPADPELMRDDTPGFDPKNMRWTMNARHVTAEEFIQNHLGKIDTNVAEQYLSDHYDSFEKKQHADRRSLCGHGDVASDPEPAWQEQPFAPGGAVTGKVMDSNMAERMSFIGRAGHPCGEDFLVAPFLAAHPEYAWQKPILHDMKAGPWTEFAAGEKSTSSGN